MELAVLALVLSSALLHALWNAFVKKQPEPEIAAAAVLAVCAAAAVVAALISPDPAFPTRASAAWSLAAGGFEAVYIIALSRALVAAPLGPVYTISRGGALLFVWPISVAFLGEKLTELTILGSGLLVIGMALSSGFRRGDRARGGALLLAVVAAAGIAGYHLCYKQALSAHGAPTGVFAVSISIAAPLNFARLGAAQRARVIKLLRARPVAMVLGGCASAASFLIFLFALERAGAGVVFTLRNTSIFFAQALSWAIGERPTVRAAMGAAAVVLGAILLGLAK